MLHSPALKFDVPDNLLDYSSLSYYLQSIYPIAKYRGKEEQEATMLRQFFEMHKITKDTVFAKHGHSPRRRCFALDSGLQTMRNNGSSSFSVQFSESIKPIFEAQTGLELVYSEQYTNHYLIIQSDEELDTISSWEQAQGKKIFLRDCLALSIALDSNLRDNTSAQYTPIGTLENKGKHNQDQDAINQLVNMVADTINDLPFYKDADLICSVPPHPAKGFDLPSSVTSLVSTKIDKQDITCGFVFGKQKSSVRTLIFDEKWDVWVNAQLSFQDSTECTVNDKTIVLIDDKYQSGTTMQYVAMTLQDAGARAVYGLSFVKTLLDTDNVDSDE